MQTGFKAPIEASLKLFEFWDSRMSPKVNPFTMHLQNPRSLNILNPTLASPLTDFYYNVASQG